MRQHKVINPHNQSIVGIIPISSKKEIEYSIASARSATGKWKETPLKTRISYVKKFGTLIKQYSDMLAKLITKEMGKPITQAKEDIYWEASFINYYVKMAPKVFADKQIINTKKENFRIIYEPYGVVVCIAPWNFPLSMANSGILPALIAGNTVVFKPSEYTSLTQKLVVDLLYKAGVPKDVLHIIIGDGLVGSMLIDQDIDLVWFTGSTKTGREIHEKCARKFIPTLLEMGGSSPAIVFADADIDFALKQLYWSRFLNCGQVCTAVKRLYVEQSIYDKFIDRFTAKIKDMTIGNPMNIKTDIGPLVSKKQLSLLKSQLNDATSKGAKVEIGGNIPNDKKLNKGNYFLPTILTNIKSSMRVVTEEVFGPILPIIPFTKEDDVIALANNTEYGLSAEVYTKDLKRAERVARQLNAGTIAINTDEFFKPECPFGGFKKSGMGKEYGEIGMQEFTRKKVIAKRKSHNA